MAQRNPTIDPAALAKSLQGLSKQTQERSAAIPEQESSMLNMMNQLQGKIQEQADFASTSRRAADEKALLVLQRARALKQKQFAASQDPFHDFVTMFTGEPDRAELQNEQDRLSIDLQEAQAIFMSESADANSKAASFERQLGNLKTINAIRTGNTAALLQQVGSLQSQIGIEGKAASADLERYKLSVLDKILKTGENTTGWDMGFIEVAANVKRLQQGRASGTTNSSGKYKGQSAEDWINYISPSVQALQKGVDEATDTNKDRVAVGGKMVPVQDAAKYITGQQKDWANSLTSVAPILNRNSQALAYKANLQYGAMAAMGSRQGSAIRQITSFSFEGKSMLEIQQMMEQGRTLMESLPPELSTALQGFMAGNLEMAVAKTPSAMAAGANKVIVNGKRMQDSFVKKLVQDYPENKDAQAGVTEWATSGRITSSNSASAITHTAIQNTPHSVASNAFRGTYLEGDWNTNFYKEYQESVDKKYADEEARIDDAKGSSKWEELMAGLQKRKLAPDRLIMNRLLNKHAKDISQNAAEKVQHVHIERFLTRLQEKYATSATFISVLGTLEKAKSPTPNLIASTLFQAEAAAKAKGELPDTVNLREQLLFSMSSTEAYYAVTADMRPNNHISSSFEHLVLGDNFENYYRKRLETEYSPALLDNAVESAKQAEVERLKAADAAAAAINKTSPEQEGFLRSRR